jgi:hypothetical protein
LFSFREIKSGRGPGEKSACPAVISLRRWDGVNIDRPLQ